METKIIMGLKKSTQGPKKDAQELTFEKEKKRV